LIRFIFLWACLYAVPQTFAADAVEEFGIEAAYDIPYAPVQPDKKVDSLRTLDIYKSEGGRRLPIILYVHAGAWLFGDKREVNLKPHYFTSQGFAFVSMNYRLRWENKVYDQVVDVITAIKWLQESGEEYGMDASRIVLMGHQSGGHLVSLAVTDRRFFEAEDMLGDNIKAVVSIDSTSYDIPRLMRELGSLVERQQHEIVFGKDEKVWHAASPVNHIGEHGPRGDIPSVALLYNPEREATALQAKGFARALTNASVEVVMIPGAADQPDRTDELIGTAENMATIGLTAFLRSQI